MRLEEPYFWVDLPLISSYCRRKRLIGILFIVEASNNTLGYWLTIWSAALRTCAWPNYLTSANTSVKVPPRSMENRICTLAISSEHFSILEVGAVYYELTMQAGESLLMIMAGRELAAYFDSRYATKGVESYIAIDHKRSWLYLRPACSWAEL